MPTHSGICLIHGLRHHSPAEGGGLAQLLPLRRGELALPFPHRMAVNPATGLGNPAHRPLPRARRLLGKSARARPIASRRAPHAARRASPHFARRTSRVSSLRTSHVARLLTSHAARRASPHFARRTSRVSSLRTPHVARLLTSHVARPVASRAAARALVLGAAAPLPQRRLDRALPLLLLLSLYDGSGLHDGSGLQDGSGV
eukprot:gene17257-biopygen4677